MSVKINPSKLSTNMFSDQIVLKLKVNISDCSFPLISRMLHRDK